MEKVWFITGSSRGLGRSLAAAVLAKGDKVVATARNTDSLRALVEEYGQHILPVKLDVTDYDQVYLAVEAAIDHFGRIDVLVNNAGFGIVGAAEAYTEAEVRSQLETNLYAPIEITRAVLPHMRQQGAGRILQISSIGGRVGNAGVTIYQAAKFGLSGFSEGLAKEVKSLGIWVTSVEPGGFRTDWAGESMSYAQKIKGYDLVDQRSDFFQSGDFLPMGDPEKAALAMISIVEAAAPPVHLVLGSEAIGMLRHADAGRTTEMDTWMGLSLSTDHDDADNFLESSLGKTFTKK